MLKWSISSILVVAGVLLFAPAPAAAQTAIVTNGGNCLIPDGNRSIRVFSCSSGGARYRVIDGRIMTADNYCFDHGVPQRANFRVNNQVTLVRCHGGKSQVWYFIADGPSRGLVQNAANPEVCLNIPSGNDASGTQMIVWGCGFNRPDRNEVFYLGAGMRHSDVAHFMRADENRIVQNGGQITKASGLRIVGAGNGNIVAAGGGNIVAAGGGNIVAAGGGNMVSAGNSNLVSGSHPSIITLDPEKLRAKLIQDGGAYFRQ